MLTIRNKGAQARAIDFIRDYPGVGRSIYMRPKETKVGLPDEIAGEKALTLLVSRGILEITGEAKAEPPETKPEKTKPRKAVEDKSEREE